MFKYEKINTELESYVSEMLASPVQSISQNEEAKASPVVVSGTDPFILPGVKFKVPDDALCNILLPDGHVYVRETLT